MLKHLSKRLNFFLKPVGYNYFHLPPEGKPEDLFPPLSPSHSWQTLCCPGISFRSQHFSFVLAKTASGCSQRRRISNNSFSSPPVSSVSFHDIQMQQLWQSPSAGPGHASYLGWNLWRRQMSERTALSLQGCLPHLHLAGVQIKLLILGSYRC